MSRPYRYGASFVTGVMGAPGSVVLPYLEVLDDLLLRQRNTWPEGRASREMLHALIDAWLDGVG